MTAGLDPEIYEDQYKFFSEYGRTRVVNIKDDPSLIDHPDFIYIGRYNSHYGLLESKWASHYIIGRDGSRDEVILKYLINMPPELLADLEELRGKILGCWCKPLSCHGDVLVKILGGRHARQRSITRIRFRGL